jgi:valyl-tRNA synthetase
MAMLQDVVRAVRNVRKSKGLADRTAVSVVINSPDGRTDAAVAAHQGFLRQMAVLEDLEHGVDIAKPTRCATAVVGTMEVFLRLEGLVDLAGERTRLEKQKSDLDRQIGALSVALHNSDFLAKAPDHVIAQKRQRAEELREQMTKVIQNLADLA